jgi:hypothetical protein
MSMQNEIAVFEKPSGINVLGLNKGQAELYKYLLSCTKEGKAVELETVCIIYYTHVAKQVREYAGWWDGRSNYKMVNGLKYYNGQKKHMQKCGYSVTNAYRPGKEWLRQNIGSFVMRGLLGVVPKFNPKEIEENGSSLQS